MTIVTIKFNLVAHNFKIVFAKGIDVRFKHLFFLTVIIGLLGCEDSPSNNTNDNGSGTVVLPVNTDDPLTEFIDAKANYTGNELIAPVNLTTTSTFLPYVFMLVPDLLPSVYNTQELHTLVDVCRDGGQLEKSRTNDEDIWLLEFNNCTDADMVKHGTAELRITERYTDGSVKSTTTIYQDVTFTYTDLQFVVRGEVSDRSLNPYCDDFYSRSTLLFTETKTNRQIYFDDFKIHDRHMSCGVSTSGISANGKIYDSELGYVSVLPDKNFRLNRFYFDSDSQGALILLGQDNSRFVWSVNHDKINTGDSDNLGIYHQFTLDEQGDGDFKLLLNVLDRLMIDEVVLSFEDSDNDGLLDGWEYAYGFDMFDPTDADLDADSDGFTNALEALYLGDPNDPESHPSIVDYSFELNHTPSAYSHQTTVELEITKDVIHNMYNNLEFSLTIAPPMTFAGVKHMTCINDPKCIISEDGQQLTLLKDTEYGISSNSGFTILLDAPASTTDKLESNITATMSLLDSYTLDSNLQNNTSQIEVGRKALYSEFYTQAFTDSHLGNGENTNVVFNIDGWANVEMFISQSDTIIEGEHSFDEIPNGYIELEMPDFVELSDLVCKTDIENCQTGDLINITQERAHTNFTLKLTAKATGRGYINVYVKSYDTGDKIFNQFQFPVIVGENTATIQEKIYAATPGDIVYVEPGIYVGSLYLANQQVHVKSEQGPENTFLYGHRQLNSRIRFGYGSSLSGFTIAQQQVASDNATNTFHNNHLVGRRFALKGVDFDLEHNLNISNNLFDYRSAGESSLLMQIAGDGPLTRCEPIHSNRESATLNLTNNIFVGTGEWDIRGTDYSRSKLCAIFYNAPASLNMKNNTITGFHNVFKYFTYPSERDENNLFLDFSNNLLTNTQYIFNSVSDETYAVSERTQISISNNLIFNSEALINPRYVNDSNVSSQYISLMNTINDDPLLTESFQLTAESPAIDAGLDVGLTLDFSNNPRPVDGNGDGSAEYDIGASEWQVDPSP